MTELEPGNPHAALWKHIRHLEGRIRALETWQEATTAVSTWRRWIFPTVVSVAMFAAGYVLRHH